MDQFFLICNVMMGLCVAGIAIAARPSYFDLVDRLEKNLADKLRTLRLSRHSLRRRIHLWLVIVAATFFMFLVAFDSLPFATLAAVMLAAGPWYIVRRIARRRREKIEDQLADAMVSFASGIRAGLSIPQTLEMLANDCPRPIKQEFAQIVGEYKMGKPLDRTLAEAKQRLRSENFVLFAAALLASRESGGRLNEIVDRISHSVLELQRLERKIMSETAQARKSAVYMALVPLVLLVVYAVIDPRNTGLLFSTLPGQIILTMSIVLNVTAYLWALKILDADISITSCMLLAASPDAVGWGASAFVGVAFGIAVWWVLSALKADEVAQGDEWRYDISRINELRRQDALYRLFQPIIQFLARLNRTAFARQLPEIQREIQAAGLPRAWVAEEYLGRMQLCGLLAMPTFFILIRAMLGVSSPLISVVFGVITIIVLRRRLTKRAKKRLLEIKRRMPFLLDLVTLLMEAGASFLKALKQGVIEFEGHPVSTEFGRVLTDMNMGKARTEAFDALRNRLNDDEIGGIVGAIIQSEILGTPLSHIFRTQSDVLQVKRTQRAETVAGEAGVNMLLPGMLVMAATVLIILGPFLLNYFSFEM